MKRWGSEEARRTVLSRFRSIAAHRAAAARDGGFMSAGDVTREYAEANVLDLLDIMAPFHERVFTISFGSARRIIEEGSPEMKLEVYKAIRNYNPIKWQMVMQHLMYIQQAQDALREAGGRNEDTTALRHTLDRVVEAAIQAFTDIAART